MNEMNEKPEDKFTAAVVLEKVLDVVFLLFIAVGIIYGTAGLRDSCIVLAVLWFIGTLVQKGIIKYVWVERFQVLIFILMCVGGPIIALVFVGQFFGWW